MTNQQPIPADLLADGRQPLLSSDQWRAVLAAREAVGRPLLESEFQQALTGVEVIRARG